MHDEPSIERRDAIAVLTIDRAARRNALSDALVENLRATLQLQYALNVWPKFLERYSIS